MAKKKTPRQYRAMAAAKAGNSTLGIPKSVGEEYVGKTPVSKRKAWSKPRTKAEQQAKSKAIIKKARSGKPMKKIDKSTRTKRGSHSLGIRA